jgi:hypothetical protein
MGLSSRKDDRRRSAIIGASIGIPAAVVGGVVMRVVEGWGGFALALVVAGLIGLSVGLVLRSRPPNP